MQSCGSGGWLFGGAKSFTYYPSVKGGGWNFGTFRVDAHYLKLGGRKTGTRYWLPHIDSKPFKVKHWPWYQIDKLRRGVK
jgi:hypothetical protein